MTHDNSRETEQRILNQIRHRAQLLGGTYQHVDQTIHGESSKKIIIEYDKQKK